MGQRRRRAEDKQPPVSYPGADGDELSLRPTMSPGTRRAVMDLAARPGASADDLWRRRSELLFERLAVSWTTAGLDPLTRQAELLGRYRMASIDERAWVDATVRRHVAEHFPELAD